MGTLKKFKYDHFCDVSLLSPNPIILDLGACVGDFANDFIQIAPGATIFCFEPSRYNFPFLLKNLDERCLPYYGAISYSNSYFLQFKENLGEPKENGYLRYHKCSYVTQKEDFTYKVPVFNFKNFSLNFDIIDFVKCDIEGSESDVILNCDQIDKINQLSIECHTNKIKKDIKQFLEENNFETTFKTEVELYAKRKKSNYN